MREINLLADFEHKESVKLVSRLTLSTSNVEGRPSGCLLSQELREIDDLAEFERKKCANSTTGLL